MPSRKLQRTVALLDVGVLCAGNGRAGALGLPAGISGAPQGPIYRTTSHSGSVSLAHLTPAPMLMPTSSASNGKESLGEESSGNLGNATSGDSSHLPALGATAAASAGAQYGIERPDSGEERGSRVLGTVFEAQNTGESHTASTPVAPAAGDSAGLTKPLDEITASMLEGEVSPVDSLNEQGSGGSDDALLGRQAGVRSDGGAGVTAAEGSAAAAPSPKRRHVLSSLLPVLSFRSSSGPDTAAQEPADVGTSSSGPAPDQDAT